MARGDIQDGYGDPTAASLQRIREAGDQPAAGSSSTGIQAPTVVNTGLDAATRSCTGSLTCRFTECSGCPD